MQISSAIFYVIMITCQITWTISARSSYDNTLSQLIDQHIGFFAHCTNGSTTEYIVGQLAKNLCTFKCSSK